MGQTHAVICGMQRDVLDHAGAVCIVLRDWSIGQRLSVA